MHYYILILLVAYVMLVFLISKLAVRHESADTFFRAGKKSPWYMVAFGMIGASISGVSFVSVPGMVINSGFSYLEVCAGFILGYIAVAYLFLPIYYKHDLTSIYSYLNKRLGRGAYLTGTGFFVLSKLLGAAAKFYVPCFVLSNVFQCNFIIVVAILLIIVWIYTKRGGIASLVWTDCLQTLCMITCLGLIIYSIWNTEHISMNKEYFSSIIYNYTSFEKEDGILPHILRFVSGFFIVIVMTGLDQDMMQKNLTCRNLRDAQKDMCTYGFAFLPINALFLLLGVLLIGILNIHSEPLPNTPDSLLTNYCISSGGIVLALFTLGTTASSLSTVDSAITALTTTICVTEKKYDRTNIHIIITILTAICCIIFWQLNSTSLIDAIYRLVSYTYGPLLGLFTFAMTHKHNISGIHCLTVCIVSPVVCLLFDVFTPTLIGYHFGYELLILNGVLTYMGLLLKPRIHNS